MQTSNISVLLNAAEYVRTETIINGNAANYLDCTIKAIRGYIADIEEATAKIEDLKAAGKERGVNMASRRLDRDKKDLAELVEQLRGWLMEYKKNHPNVKISIETESTTEEPTEEEETHAAHCLSVYLNNDSHIYEHYTQKAIEAIVNEGATLESEKVKHCIKTALYTAGWQVERFDHLTPTPADIERVKAGYIDYIIECAEYQTKTA